MTSLLLLCHVRARGFVPPAGPCRQSAPGPKGEVVSSPRAAPRRSARGRILGWYVVLIGCVLVAALIAQRQFLVNRLDRDVDAELARTVAAFQQVAAGDDPATGEPFGGDIGAIVDSYLAVRVGVSGSAVVMFVDGEPWASDLPGLTLVETDALQEWSTQTDTTTGQTQVDGAPVRVLAAPVAATDRGAGVFVVTIDMAPRLDEVDRAVGLATTAAVGVFLLASLAAWWAAGRVLRPLRQLRDTADGITEDDLTARIDIDRNDEIGQLAVTFNRMLDRLEQAFQLHGRFVDDAGHELRTPITIIRGQLEMVDDDPADRAQTMAIVDSELDRMSRIVEDLLVLARQDQPDFVLPRPLDLPDLVDDIGQRASALVGHAVPVVECPPAIVMLDQQRIVQAMMNLVRNADQHTPEGTAISVGATMLDGAVRLWVHDEGPGIPPEEIDTVMQRFGRGSTGPRTGGAGLGLAIVDAIAQSHGGTVTIESEPGSTTVGVTIPQPDAPTDEHDPADHITRSDLEAVS